MLTKSPFEYGVAFLSGGKGQEGLWPHNSNAIDNDTVILLSLHATENPTV